MVKFGRLACFIGLACCTSVVGQVKVALDSDSREARFAKPPMSCRLLPIVHRPESDAKRQEQYVRHCLYRGYGGYATNLTLRNRAYLEAEESWPPFIRWTELCRKAGMALWLYDEDGYPSGTAGKIVMRNNPEWEVRGLLLASKTVKNGESVTLEFPPGKLHRVGAIPYENGRLAFEKTQFLNVGGDARSIAWTAPAGKEPWRLYAMSEDFLYEGTHAALSLSRKNRYINLLMKEPVAKFIEVTHEAYAKRLGDNLKAYTSTFTDEPSLMSVWMRAMPYVAIPTSPDFPSDYKAATGRDLLEDAPYIAFDDMSPECKLRRLDFWSLVGHHVAEHFMGQITDWCTAHGILSGGHLLAEEGLRNHVGFYGDFFRVLRRMSAPGIDCLTSLPQTVPWQTALFAGSAAALNGSDYVMCEVSDHSQRYRRAGDKRPQVEVTESEVMGTLHRLAWGGVNTLTSYYRFGTWKSDALVRVNERIGRVLTLLREGYNTSDIAVLYPVSAFQTATVPRESGNWSRELGEVEDAFRNAGKLLYHGNRSFIYVDESSLAASEVKAGGVLSYKQLGWRVLVLPCATALSRDVMKNVRRFWQEGGVVIATHQVPVNSPGVFPDPEMIALSKEMFGEESLTAAGSTCQTSSKGGIAIYLPGGDAMTMMSLLDKILESPLREIREGGSALSQIRTAWRRTPDNGDILFIANDTEQAWKGTLSLSGDVKATLWRQTDGSKTELQLRDGRFELSLGGYEACVVTTDKALSSRRLSSNGVLLSRAEPRPLPLVGKVSNSMRGLPEMESTLTPLADGWWKADATLHMGGVDTFQWATFRYPKSIFASDDRGLHVTLRVREERYQAPLVRVFLKMDNGILYLATASTTLEKPGERRLYFPWESFVLHGKKDGHLDTSRVRVIQVGWGGHFGYVGQKIGFEVKEPMVFK